MKLKFKEFTNSKGEKILYVGNPNLEKLEHLSHGLGDVWHSSFEQGYKNTFPEIVYFAVVFFWYINDFNDLDECVSWRINPENFAIRKKVWDDLDGFDDDFMNPSIQALDFGYNLLKNNGAIPLYVKGLFADCNNTFRPISRIDRYVFFRRNFKAEHSIYMLLRNGFWNISEWNAFIKSKKYSFRTNHKLISIRKLNEIEGKPTVSYIIPTMLRQDFTLNLLEDLKNQTYLPTQVVVVDATPEDKRDLTLYKEENYPFEVIFKWQTTKGSCRARNEAIDLCIGDYVVFGDDDIRFFPDFIENHIRLLQTYGASACNGLDIMADNQQQNLNDLKVKIDKLGSPRWKVGASQSFSNANSCVKLEYVHQLIGNDINFDGGYGEDSDFGMSLTKIGQTILHNPFSVNLHLKPQKGGYRFWGEQAKILGKKRKKQPWELETPVKNIRPVPSPTIMYQIHKHFNERQVKEYRYKYFSLFLFKGIKWQLPLKIVKLPYKILQFNKSVFYAKKLINLGKRTS